MCIRPTYGEHPARKPGENETASSCAHDGCQDLSRIASLAMRVDTLGHAGKCCQRCVLALPVMRMSTVVMRLVTQRRADERFSDRRRVLPLMRPRVPDGAAERFHRSAQALR